MTQTRSPARTAMRDGANNDRSSKLIAEKATAETSAVQPSRMTVYDGRTALAYIRDYGPNDIRLYSLSDKLLGIYRSRRAAIRAVERGAP